MLARSNAFHNLPCPFFSTGLCERPYCHFKHDVQNKDTPRTGGSVHTSTSVAEKAQSAPAAFGGYVATVDRPPVSSAYGSVSSQPPPPSQPTIIQQEGPSHFSGYTGYFASYNSVDYSPAASSMTPGDDDPYSLHAPTPAPSYGPVARKGLLGDSPPKLQNLPPKIETPVRSGRDVPDPIQQPTASSSNESNRPQDYSYSSSATVKQEEYSFEETEPYVPQTSSTRPPTIFDPKKKAEAINEMAKNISEIDRQIAEVKKQMYEEPKFSSDEDDEYTPTETNLSPAAAPHPKLPSTESTKTAKAPRTKPNIPSYTATPISELEKKKKKEKVKVPTTLEEKVARHKAKLAAEAKAAIKTPKLMYKPVEKKAAKPVEAPVESKKLKKPKVVPNPPVERDSSQEPDPPKKKKKKDKKAKSPQRVQIEDIFGNDSEDDDALPSPPKINEAPPDLVIPETSLKRQKSSEETGRSPKKKKSKKEKLEAKLSNGSSEGSSSKEKVPKKKSKDSGPKDLSSDAPETQSKEILDIVPLGKQRRAHGATHNPEMVREKAKISGPRGHVLSARETLNMRFLQMQREKEAILKKAAAAEEKKDAPTNKAGPSTSSERVAHDPAKAMLSSHRDNAVAATVPKGQTRKAHVVKPVPKGSGTERPKVKPELGGKIDLATRQRYLDLMVDECVQLIEIPQDAYEVALNEEKAVYAKSKSKTGYLSGATHVIKKFRDERQKYGGSSNSSGVHPAMGVSHSKLLDGKSEGTFTVNRTSRPKAESIFSTRRGLSVNQEKFFYENLIPYILAPDQLDENGFPRPNPNASDTPVFRKPDMKLTIIDDNEMKRVCCRCGRGYRLLESGEYAFPEDCIYHPGKAWKRKGPGGFEQRFNCCQADLKNPGCQLAENHVSGDVRKCDAGGYVQTKTVSLTPTGEEDSRNHKIYALDCEMVYTVYGVALARVTVVDASCGVVFEALIQPKYKIVDYNSRFSGLRVEDFEKAERVYTQEEVQDHLLEMISSETILIGHSLESDLRALKIIHSKVVDTSLVFPHKMGPPYKRALKTIVAEYLKKIIQEDVAGHDSKEDAAGCMELMLYKVQEDLKIK